MKSRQCFRWAHLCYRAIRQEPLEVSHVICLQLGRSEYIFFPTATRNKNRTNTKYNSTLSKNLPWQLNFGMLVVASLALLFHCMPLDSKRRSSA